MNITLLYPLLSRKRSKIDENKQYWPPLGLAYIASALGKDGHRVQIIDRDVLLRRNSLDFGKVDVLTEEMIDGFATDVIGISATTPNIPDVYHIAKMLKRSNPKRKIVLGGPHASGEPKLTLTECPDIDIVARGEGEFTMLDIARGRPPKEIEGITYVEGNKIISNPDRKLLQDIDELPLPARHLLDMAFYTRPSRFTSRNLSLRTTSIFTARGCPYRCNFCAGPLVFKGKVRFHSKERVVEEIDELVNRYGIEALYFAEDMFLSSMRRAQDILTLFMAKGLHKRLKWFAQVKASVVTEELLKLMKESGCVGVEFGFESGSQKVLDRMNKKIKLDENLKAAHLAKKVGIRFQGNIIVGYPGETEEDFNKTLHFLWRTKPNNIGFNIFMPLPGTPAYEELKREGKELPRWEDIGDPETPQVNFADMPPGRFEQLYFKARFKIILPINFYYFVKFNIKNPMRFFLVLFTQFKGVLVKSLRAMIKLVRLKTKGEEVRVLYLSYNGLLEPILPSQGVPYMRELNKRAGINFVLLTWEKNKDIKDKGKDFIEDLKKRLKEDGIEWHHLGYHKRPRYLSTFYDLLLGTLFCLYLIPKKKIGIIHTRGVTPGVIPLILSKFFRIKIIYDMRGLLAEEYVGGGLWEESGLAFNLVKWVEERMLRIADGIVVLTRKHYDLTKNLRFVKGTTTPMEVIPCCVDTGSFNYVFPGEKNANKDDLKKILNLEDKFVLLYPGKIGSFYFMDEMLDFFKEFMELIPNVVFLVLTRDRTEGLMKRAEEKGVALDKMRIMSSSYEDMPEFTRLADAGIFFINPYKKIGSSPIKLGEFLASGVPVIINPGVGDSEELVRNNRVGVVVPKFDREGYHDAIHKLLNMKREGDGLKVRCRQTAQEYLSLDKGAEKYLGIYESLIKAP